MTDPRYVAVVTDHEPLVDTARLTRLATALIWIWLATDVALGMSALYTIRVLGGLGGAIAPAESFAGLEKVLAATGVLNVLAVVAAGIAVLRWIYRTSRNAHAIGPAMAFTPGWAVGWFFVPIANLWKPFQAVGETWQVSADPDAPDAVPIPAVLRIWWGCWIASSIISNIDFRLSMRAETAEQLIAASWFTVAAVPVDIALTIALTTIMRRLSQMQRDRAGDIRQARPQIAEDATFE
ncbi:DUF4328 domain-containing protein [Sphingomonas faeni]|uniref:DUF4328 domain-containing protein n=1 Tax=Sphingomonas faeni TaxID=185950 RepID=UPI0020C74895|nr:DUF4328 domain-containing protein [Sphingomonas faeni]